MKYFVTYLNGKHDVMDYDQLLDNLFCIVAYTAFDENDNVIRTWELVTAI